LYFSCLHCACAGTHCKAYFLRFLFADFQRVCAAFLPCSLSALADNFAARALPPFEAPNNPSATAAGFFFGLPTRLRMVYLRAFVRTKQPKDLTLVNRATHKTVAHSDFHNNDVIYTWTRELNGDEVRQLFEHHEPLLIHRLLGDPLIVPLQGTTFQEAYRNLFPEE
jgi:hypothetical protein